MGQRMGRPPKATTAEKLAIVDQYYITNSDGDAFILRAHGIYKKLSAYAKLKGYALEPHDFSRDTAVREYIDSLINTSVQKEKSLFGGTVGPSAEPTAHSARCGRL